MNWTMAQWFSAALSVLYNKIQCLIFYCVVCAFMNITRYEFYYVLFQNLERRKLLSVNCHIWTKKIFQKAYLRYISVYFGRKSKKKRFIIHGEGLLWRTDLAPTELQSYSSLIHETNPSQTLFSFQDVFVDYLFGIIWHFLGDFLHLPSGIWNCYP